MPPSFYETTSGSSLFGSQNSPKIEKEDTRGAVSEHFPLVRGA